MHFYFELNQPKKKYAFTVPVTVNGFDVKIKKDWVMFWIGFSVLPVLITLLFVIGKIYKPV